MNDNSGKVKMVKQLITLAVSVSVGYISTCAIRHVVPVDGKILSKAAMAIGGMAIGGMISDAASEYTEKNFDIAIEKAREGLVIEETELETEPEVVEG